MSASGGTPRTGRRPAAVLPLVPAAAAGPVALVVAVLMTGGSSEPAAVGLGLAALVGTDYGAPLLAKAAALAALGAAGWGHRRRTVTQVARGDARAFWRLAGAEAGLMAVALGLAVALTRTAAG